MVALGKENERDGGYEDESDDSRPALGMGSVMHAHFSSG